MKKLMLASASALLFAGVALAQTSTPATPAPMQKPMSHMAPMSHMSHMSHMGNAMAHPMPAMVRMPENASANVYLHIAGQAIMAHNKMRAHEALGRAETDMLTGSYVQGSVNGPIHTPEIATIEQARHAVMAGDYHTAMMMTHKAMTMMHGPMAHGPMMHGAMAHGAMAAPSAMAHGNTMAPPAK